MTARYSASAQLSGSRDDVLAQAADILAAKLHGRRLSRDTTGVTARTRAGFRSFGEEVRVTVDGEAPGPLAVTVLSESAFKTVLLDWGKNRDNVEILLSELRRRAQGSP